MEERINQILKHIKKSGEAKLPELCEMFPGVSSMTLRRDLEKLENMGEIIRIRGGAKSVEFISRLREEQYSRRTAKNIDKKRELARKAYPLIMQDSTIFLDSGTTAKMLADMITYEKLFIITAAPNIAMTCAVNPNASIFMTGGLLNSSNLSLSGTGAVKFLDNINIDIAFMAASGFSGSFDCGNYDECQLKKHVVSTAEKIVLLMDSTKVGRRMPFKFAELSDVNYIATDSSISPDFVAEAEKYDVVFL
jgi:DeoR/GlpR family transcriptional regulator of sugar metabolism